MNTNLNTHRSSPPCRTSGVAATLAGLLGLASLAGTAQAQQISIAAWRQSDEYRAMKLQRELAANIPQDQSLLLGSHNSYASSAYGNSTFPYPSYQHSYTLSEQLDLGLRQLDIDVHHVLGFPNELFVSHASCTGVGYIVGQLTLGEALVEIRTWMNNNPDEVVQINFEQHFPFAFPSDQHNRMVLLIELIFGGFGPTYGPDVLIRPTELALTNQTTQNNSDNERRAVTLTTSTLTQLRVLGRVVCVNTGGVDAPCRNNYWPDYPNQDVMLGDVVSFNWGGQDNWNTIYARDFAEDPTMHYWGTAPRGAQKRLTIHDYSSFDMLYNNSSTGQFIEYGSEPPAVIREAVRAGIDYVRFDPVGKSEGVAGNPIEYPADEQMRATIWSWDYRYLPPIDGQPRAAMAVIEGDTARIRWEVPAAEMRYATQGIQGNWGISGERGAFGAAPVETLGGTNFRVPGNAFEMQNLFGQMVRAGVTKCWVNYQDLDGDGAWSATTQPRRFSAGDAAPQVSAVPSLVGESGGLFGTLNLWALQATPASGRVLCVYPGSYGTAFVIDKACTIVPGAHGFEAAIGRP